MWFFLLILLELQQAQNEQLKQQDRQKLTQFLAPTRRRTQEMFGLADTFLPNADDDDTQSAERWLGAPLSLWCFAVVGQAAKKHREIEEKQQQI